MDTIMDKKVELIEWLCGVGIIIQYAQSRKLITGDEYTRVKSIQDPSEKVTELLDIILLKGDPVCINFLELLREDKVNESRPELRDWISTVNTSALAVKKENRTTTQARNMAIPGSSVTITATDGGSVYAPQINNAQISGGFSLDMSSGHQKKN